MPMMLFLPHSLGQKNSWHSISPNSAPRVKDRRLNSSTTSASWPIKHLNMPYFSASAIVTGSGSSCSSLPANLASNAGCEYKNTAAITCHSQKHHLQKFNKNKGQGYVEHDRAAHLDVEEHGLHVNTLFLLYI